MNEILAVIAAIVKATEGKPMLELVKSKWIKFSVGMAILAWQVLPYLPEIIKALK